MKNLLVICGATATGKTKLAVECAKALSSQVISADSQLIYRDLNVGTAKPTTQEMQGVKHHMIDIVSPFDSFSVSDYEKAALPIVENLQADGKIPVVCGGTGFYINSLLFKFGYGNVKANIEIRNKYEQILEEKGKEYLFSLLRSVDPETCEKLHVNDVKRVIRALEIYEVSGKKKSDQNDEMVARFDYLAVAVDYPREKLYERIDNRVDDMFKNGLVEEVQSLLADGVDEKCQCLQAIGYKEIVECLKNGDNESTMRDIIKQNTRHYAKRQLTFFKKLKNIVWLSEEQANVKTVLEMLNG